MHLVPRQARLALAVCVLCSLPFLGACGGEDEGEPEDSGSGGNGTTLCGLSTDGEGSLVMRASEASNYTFISSLELSEVAVAPRSELSFDWSAVTRDFSLHEVDPLNDIDMLAVIVWKLSAEELAVKLNDDNLSQSDFEAIAMIYTENAVTSGNLFDFTEFGVEIDSETLLQYVDPELFDPATHSYTAMATTGTTPGKGTRMIKAFRMDDSSTNTEVVLDTDSAALSFMLDMASLEPVSAPTGVSDIVIDWSNIATNAMGAEFDPTAITEVAVGKYSFSVAELEDQFLDLDLIADEIYWGDVLSGSSFSLADTATEAGASFPGFDDSGTWLVGLRCGTCTNPAPWYLTVIEPCSEMGEATEQAMGAEAMGE